MDSMTNAIENMAVPVFGNIIRLFLIIFHFAQLLKIVFSARTVDSLLQ
jgi:hypothetical protein